MLNKINPNLLFRIEVFVTSLCFILLSVPAFNMTGLVVKPLLLCFIGGVTISTVLSFIHAGEKICGKAQLLFILFWLVFALIKELQLQQNNGFPGKWIYFFYFDKLLMVGAIWLSSTLAFILKRIISKKCSVNYSAFFKYSSAAFIVFYAFLLVYSFILIRLEKGVYPLNWIPFNTIKEYISDYSSIPYEVFMMFFGNLLYFTPLGVIFYLLLKKQKIYIKLFVLTLFPLLAFTLLEFSQYFFQNGFCEFDDMMMNSFGFWLGALLGTFADAVVKKCTKGRIISFWG